jgi:hypothetical protein
MEEASQFRHLLSKLLWPPAAISSMTLESMIAHRHFDHFDPDLLYRLLKDKTTQSRSRS